MSSEATEGGRALFHDIPQPAPGSATLHAAGKLPAEEEPEKLAAELTTMLTGTDIAYLLHEDRSILDCIRAGIRTRVESLSGNGAKVQKPKS